MSGAPTLHYDVELRFKTDGDWLMQLLAAHGLCTTEAQDHARKWVRAWLERYGTSGNEFMIYDNSEPETGRGLLVVRLADRDAAMMLKLSWNPDPQSA